MSLSLELFGKMKDERRAGGKPMTEDMERIRKGQDIRDSDRYLEGKRNIENKRGYLSETFNFACVLRGEVKHLEKIKEYIVQEYVDTGVIKLIKPTYEKKEIYIVTEEEWEEYQKLKQKDERLIGAGWI